LVRRSDWLLVNSLHVVASSCRLSVIDRLIGRDTEIVADAGRASNNVDHVNLMGSVLASDDRLLTTFFARSNAWSAEIQASPDAAAFAAPARASLAAPEHRFPSPDRVA
jgi:hypothetical protein